MKEVCLVTCTDEVFSSVILPPANFSHFCQVVVWERICEGLPFVAHNWSLRNIFLVSANVEGTSEW